MEEFHWMLHHTRYSSLSKIIDKAETNVGRSKDIDISSRNLHVSRKHATFVLDENQTLYVKDHNTRNGTYVNKVKILPSVLVQLSENDEVGLGLHSGSGLDRPMQNDNPDLTNLIFLIKRSVLAIKQECDNNDYFDLTQEIKLLDAASRKSALSKEDSVKMVVPSTFVNKSDFLIPSFLNWATYRNSTGGSSLPKDNAEKDFLKPCCSKWTTEADERDRGELTSEELLKILDATQYEEMDNEAVQQTAKTESKCNYSMVDDYIIVSDDDDDEVLFSQILDDCETDKNKPKDVDLNDSLFAAIKQEVEELDRVPEGTVFSRICLDDDEDQSSFDYEFESALNGNTSPPDQTKDDDETPARNKPQIPNDKIAVVLLTPLPPIKKQNKTHAAQIDAKETSANAVRTTLQSIKKRKHTEKENTWVKRLKTFGKSPNTKLNTPAAQEIKAMRKELLKEIALKSATTNSKTDEVKQNACAKKVKLSDGRGKFLADESKPSTSAAPLEKHDGPSKNVQTKRTVQIVPPHVMKKAGARKVAKKTSPISIASSSSGSDNEIRKPHLKTHEELESIVSELILWNPLWFSEYYKNPEWGLPEHIKKDLRDMIESFSSYSEYYNIVIPQMMIELWHFFYKEIQPSSDPRKKAFVGLLQEERRIPHKYTELTYTTYINKRQNDNHTHVKKDDVVVIQYRREDQKKVVLGYVIKVTEQYVSHTDRTDPELVSLFELEPHVRVNFVLVVKSSTGTAILGSSSKIRIITSVISTMRIFKSVYRLKDSPLQAHILKPTKHLYKTPTVKSNRIYSKEHLNETQRKSVLEASAMCLGKLPGIYLIQGPPGTGKTTVILNIVQQILFHPNHSNHRCILVVAPSNGAVDELALRIIGLKSKFSGANKKLKLVRMGPKNMVHPKVQDYLLYEIAKRNLSKEAINSANHSSLKVLESKQKAYIELRDHAGDNCSDAFTLKLNKAKTEFESACKRIVGARYHEKLTKHEKSLLKGAEIICTTLSSCMGLRMEEVFGRSSRNKITCCIVDEATQSNEQETLIPLILGVDKLILVGDPKQLPAVTQTKEAKDFGYGKSLFSRIMSNFPADETNPVQLLTTQYRMHPDISQFPNSLFYNGQLKDASCVKNRKSAFSILKPYVVFNFDMEAIVNSQEYSNNAEIICVLKVLNVLSDKFKKSFNFSVGIITPYNNQRNRIIDELKSKTFHANIAVNTVDSFQGQEKDVIIMSCVRENTNTFVTDEQRLNVALTRAKHALYIIGSSSLFKTSGIFGTIRDDACRRKLLVEINSRTTEKQLLDYISKDNRR